MKKKLRDNTTEITVVENQCPIPLESLAILVNGEDNKHFRVLSKHITTENLKVILKHKSTGERVKLLVPIEFLDYHKIPFRHLVIPNDTQLLGVLNKKVDGWEVQSIITDALSSRSEGKDPESGKTIVLQEVPKVLVIVKCKQSGKTIACEMKAEVAQATELYIEKAVTYKASHFNIATVNIWRETACQREMQVRQNLQRLMSSQAHMRV